MVFFDVKNANDSLNRNHALIKQSNNKRCQPSWHVPGTCTRVQVFTVL